MTPERFRQIEQLATLVLQREPSEWKAFLDKACSGDRELRREVESLLSADANAGNFLAEPAAPLVAERSANVSEPLDHISRVVTPKISHWQAS